MPSSRRFVAASGRPREVARYRRGAVALLTLVCAAALRPARLTGQPNLNTAQVGITPNFSGGSGPFQQVVNGFGHVLAGGGATGGPIGPVVPSGDASADVSPGIVKLFASAFASTNSVARGIFRDQVTFTSPVLPTGTFVTVPYFVGMDGLLQINFPPGIGVASWQLQAVMGGGAFQVSRGGQLNNASGNVVYTGDPLGLYLGIATVQIGIPAQIDAEFTISAQAAFDFVGPGDATANFLNTGFWGGIQSVNFGGAPVAFSVTSLSGTDWTQSFASPATTTPEPATWTLLAAGLVAIGTLRRRRA